MSTIFCFCSALNSKNVPSVQAVKLIQLQQENDLFSLREDAWAEAADLTLRAEYRDTLLWLEVYVTLFQNQEPSTQCWEQS